MTDHHIQQTSSLSRFAFALAFGAALFLPTACKATFHNSIQAPSVQRDALTLESNSESRSRGFFGGAVSPSQWKLRVVNRSGVGTGWRITSDRPWLTVPVAIGSTAARAESAFDACIDPDAARLLGIGEHKAHVKLFAASDTTTVLSTVEIVLEVTPASVSGTHASSNATNVGTQQNAAETGTVAHVSNVETADLGHWTDLQPSPDSRLIYVSSATGNDANSGLTPQQAKATIAAGKALMRNGFPDWLMLQRGNTWAGSFGQWIVSGRSPSEPAVVSTYGSEELRPHLATGTQDGLFTIQNSASPALLRHVRIVGLRFTCNGYTGTEGTPRGINWHVPFEDVLVEDCSFQYFHTNIVIEPLGESGRDFRLRRSIVADAFTTQNSHSQGLYVSNTEGVLLEENVFDHNGWREDVAGAVPTIFRHNVYLQTDVTMVRALGNIFASGASHGLQARDGGLVEDNLFVNNAIALLLGSDWQTKEPIRFIARRNVITAGRDLDQANPRGFGIDVPSAASGLIARNLIVNQRNVGFPVAMNLYDGTTAAGLHDVVVEGNIIHDWSGAVIIQGAAPRLTGLVFRLNVISDTVTDNLLVENTLAPNGSVVLSGDNMMWSSNAPANSWCRIGTGNVSFDMWKTSMGDTNSRAEMPQYFEADRTVETYDDRIGGAGTLASFMASARRQSKASWQPEYTAPVVNNWMRAGFRWQE
ncbi:MAG: hypothetical protein SGI72_10660 [Planctomycetota bacterium]|nr:hypothetical protein [Planctomycetota bacterium]